jgi:pyruvate kinase
LLAALHPRQPLLAFTVDARVRSQLALSWGVETFLVPAVSHTDDMVRQVDFSLMSIGRLREGDHVVVVAGSPPNTVGSTNLIRVHEVGTDS